VGGFGITGSDDLLFVKEFVTIRQQVSPIRVRFDDEAVGQFFDGQVDLGRQPEQFARIWCHTHPDMSPWPSFVDEDTFWRVFGSCQWAVMFILAGNGQTYARLGFNVGPGGQVLIPIAVDYSGEFGASDREAWDAEYEANVTIENPPSGPSQRDGARADAETGSSGYTCDLMEELEYMDPARRQLFLDELAERPELWTDGIEEIYI